MFDHGAVFARERHHVGYRGDGDQLQQRCRNALDFGRRPIEPRHQRLRQLECHARPAQILLRVGAVRPIGVEHRQRPRQDGFGQMMIGDDHVDAQLPGPLHHGGGANSGIHADDQPDTLGGGLLHHISAHAVAIFQPVRDVIAGAPAGQLDDLEQEDDRECAIHVVVAVDQDFLVVANGGQQAVNGRLYVSQQRGGMKVGEGGRKKSARCRRIQEAAPGQHAGSQDAHPQVARQAGDGRAIETIG
jgi:hypothetical protein